MTYASPTLGWPFPPEPEPEPFFISVNGSTAQELILNGYSFGTPTSAVVQVALHAGSNQIEFSNPSNYAPNLDSIIISPPIDF